MHAEFTEERQRLMERMLTCYCKQRNLKYKQGMNEVWPGVCNFLLWQVFINEKCEKI